MLILPATPPPPAAVVAVESYSDRLLNRRFMFNICALCIDDEADAELAPNSPLIEFIELYNIESSKFIATLPRNSPGLAVKYFLVSISPIDSPLMSH